MPRRPIQFLFVGTALLLALGTLFIAYRNILSEDETISNRAASRRRPFQTRESEYLGDVDDDRPTDPPTKPIRRVKSHQKSAADGAGTSSARSSQLDTLLSADGDILNNPFVDLLRGYYNGTRSFSHVCAIPTQKRIEVKAMSVDQMSAVKRGDKSITYYSGEHFLIRDVCALGHFPKELTHLFTHVWREVMEVARDPKQRASVIAEYDALMAGRAKAASNTDKNNKAVVDDLEKIYYIMGPRVVPHVIIGNTCVSRAAGGATANLIRPDTSPHRGNKHTGVFHKVMVHWIRAIMYPWLDQQYSMRDAIGGYPEVRTFLTDGEAAKGDDEATFFPFGRGGRHGEDEGMPTDGQFLDSVSFYEDYLADPQTKANRRLVCFERLYEREERWRWFPNFEVAHRFRLMLWRYFAPLKDIQRRRIYNLLTVPFPKQAKLKVLILRRDEDRHFNEKEAAAFIKDKFSAVADIKLVQYDSGGGHKPPPYYEQVLELAQADVVIAAHGAALSSMMVMRPGSVMVELFPHNFRYYMYEELAKVMGIEYVAYEGERVSPRGCCGGRDWAAPGAIASQSIEGGNGIDGDGGFLKSADSDSHLLNFSSKGNEYVQMSRADRLRLVGKIYDLHGNRNCKKCDIEVDRPMWFEIVKNALASVWLSNSRLSNLHDFDVRK